jgi:polyribonucleotide nucleotidyltransferase
MHLKKSVKIGDTELTIETGHMAKQADGSVVVRYGDTMLLVTAVSAREKKDVDFLPSRWSTRRSCTRPAASPAATSSARAA